MKRVFLIIITAFALWSCSDSKVGNFETADTMAYAMTEEIAVQEENESGDFSEDSQTEQKIIKNGNLRFQTSDLDKTATQIYDAVKKYKAQIQSDSEGKNYRSFYRDITIRVPSKDFENLVEDVGQGVSYFDTKEISSQDITERYIDIESRLKAKKELENRYLEILKKATKVSEILEIEKELSNIREEIEAKQGQLNYLQNRVSFSTLNIHFYKETADIGVTNSYGSKVWNAIKGGFEGISSFFLGLLYIWPFILLSVIAYYIVRKKIRKRKNK